MSAPAPGLPAALQVEISSACNLHCRTCPRSIAQTASSRSPGHMTSGVWRKVYELAAQVRQVNLAGFGETLAHPECVNFLEQLERAGVSSTMATNATLVTQELAERLARIRTLTTLTISLHPQQEEQGLSELAPTFLGLERLLKAFSFPRKIVVALVATRENLRLLGTLPGVLADLGVKRFVLQELIEYHADLQRERVIDGGDNSQIRSFEEALRRRGIMFTSTIPDRLIKTLHQSTAARRDYYSNSAPGGGMTRQCALPWEVPFIDKDGRIFACCEAAAKNTAPLGDLSVSDFGAIWLGEQYTAFRNALHSGKAVPELCRHCTAAPWGQHAFKEYAAEIDFERSVLNGSEAPLLVVKNTGRMTWDAQSLVRTGTARPRDRKSAFVRWSWLSLNRACSFREAAVAPGETATFEFKVTPRSSVESERFQLVADGVCWLPGTEFEVRPGKTRASLSVLTLSAVRRAAGLVCRLFPKVRS